MTPHLVDAGYIAQSFAADPDFLGPPERPRLIPELLVLPIGDDGVMFVGTENDEVVRGRSARELVPRLLPLMNGERTIAAIAAAARVSPAIVEQVVALLYSRGVLEEGPPADLERADDPRFGDALSYFGRHVDVSRSNRNRYGAFARLQAATVAVVGPAPAATAFARMLEQSGVGRAPIVDDPDAIDGLAPDMVVVIAAGEADDPSATVAAAWRRRTRCLHVRIGAREAQIGPLFRRGLSACYDCFRRIHGVPPGAPSTDDLAFWSGLAALLVIQVLSRLARSPQGGVTLYTQDGTGDVRMEWRAAPLMPGCAECGVGGRPLDPEDPSFAAWAYHNMVQFPGREALSPKEHQTHYMVANVKLALGESPGFVNAPTTRLAPASGVSGSAPWLAGPRGAAQPLDLAFVTQLLARSGGYASVNGTIRRVAPTGGNLGSNELMLVARDIDGLAPGIYSYNASRHALERLRDVDDAALARALGTREPLPPCLIVTTGALPKAQGKYSGFGYRLCYLDGGVAATYVHAIAAAAALQTRELSEFDDRDLQRVLGIDHGWALAPTCAIALDREAVRTTIERPNRDVTHALLGLCERPDPARVEYPVAPRTSAPRIRGLDDVLLARRAYRDYDDRPIDAAEIQALTAQVAEFQRYRIGRGAADVRVRPLVAVRLGTPELPAGLYLPRDSEPQRLEQIREGFSLAEARECVIQNTLAEAPLAILFLADLDAAFLRRGPRGYREAATTAAAMAAQVWLAATSYGLGACAAGGIASGATAEVSGLDPYTHCPIFSIFVGHKRDVAR